MLLLRTSCFLRVRNIASTVFASFSLNKAHVFSSELRLTVDNQKAWRLTTGIKTQTVRFTGTDSAYKPEDRVKELVQSNRIVVFMKGTPNDPRCGFSNAVCRILEMHGILDKAKDGKVDKLFASYDVLENDELRTAAKSYADWPTFPQVYFDGEFVGGCDILLEMHRSGKLSEELERLGIGSVLPTSTVDNST